MRTNPIQPKLIETEAFPIEFLSALAERESWRKEIHRPIYHVHKWWAKRLGSVFRGILLGCMLEDELLESAFYRTARFSGISVFDPFMGSGTTVGEAHKLGFTALGRDINPVAVQAVRVALGPLDLFSLEGAFAQLSRTVGAAIRELYRSTDSDGNACNVLYHFWVMQAPCPGCAADVDLFSSYVFARNAYPSRVPTVHIVCPGCGAVFDGNRDDEAAVCPTCDRAFPAGAAPAKGAKATCSRCSREFSIIRALNGQRPRFRQYAKLVLRADGGKEYLPATTVDHEQYDACARRLREDEAAGAIRLPSLTLAEGFNTDQAIRYGFRSWRDFFNDRQLFALAHLHKAIGALPDQPARNALLTLFSGALEFNNMFASYKGEGTGAVRHMFSHHILKPERMALEANIWGTPKSSGSFSGLYRSRLLRALEYRACPVELNGASGRGVPSSPPFSGLIEPSWPSERELVPAGIYLSCGDSARTGLAPASIELVITDPPFFDNVHYAELADFFYAWQHLNATTPAATTRNDAEVQDTDPERFSRKLETVFRECVRVLKQDGLLAFTYHHSREDGWISLARAVMSAGLVVVNSQPVKAEMSVATPKAQAKEPIQFDIVLVCRKSEGGAAPISGDESLLAANRQVERLRRAGFRLSRNDCKVILNGQLLRSLGRESDPVELLRAAEIAPLAFAFNSESVMSPMESPSPFRALRARTIREVLRHRTDRPKKV